MRGESMGAMQSPESQMPRHEEPTKHESPAPQMDSGVHKVDKAAIEAGDAAKLAEVEANFFGEGNFIDQMHQAGETVAKSGAEKKGDANAEAHAMRMEADKNRTESADLRMEVLRLEKALAERKIDNPIDTLADRAKDGWWTKLKRRLTSSSEDEALLAQYDAASKMLADKQSSYNELMNRMNHPERIDNAMKNKSERNQPGI